MRNLEILHRIAAIIFYVVATVVMMVCVYGVSRVVDGIEDWDSTPPGVDCSYVRAPECSPAGGS